MNRFGIRLAAGIAVICLGTLAIFQARSDSDDSKTEWPSTENVAAEVPPAPLGVGEWPDAESTDPLLIRGNDASATQANLGPPASVPPVDDWSTTGMGGGVQLASHEEPAEESTGASPAESDIAFDFPQPLAPASDIPGSDATLADPGAPQETAGPSTYGFANPLSMPTLDPTTAGGGAADFGAETELGDASPQIPAAQDPSIAPLDASAQDPVQDPGQQPADAPPTSLVPQSETALGPISSGVADSEFAAAGVVDSVEAPRDDATQSQDIAEDQGQGDALDISAANWGQPALTADSAAIADVPDPLVPLDAGSPSNGLRSAPGAPSSTGPSITASAQPVVAGPSGTSMAAAAMTIPSAQSGAPVTQLVEAVEVLSEPGERNLEGAQTPTVVIQKRAPAEVRVGKAADFVISVRNVGTVPALDVRVFDTVPDGTTLVEAVPPAQAVQDMLAWQLGDLKPGEERTIRMKLMPETEGEIGSVARVTFEAAASVRTLATKPVLELEQRAPEQVLIGQQLEIEVELRNTGSGSAENLVLQTDLPEGLEHPMGRQLDNLIGTMLPGDQRRQTLRLRATKPGSVQNVIQLTSPDGVSIESVVNIDVISPTLQVGLDGPSLRYLERQTTYNVQIANTGTANASEINLVAYLDSGLKFVSTDFEGQYDPSQHAVFWSLAELPPGQSGEVPLTLLPVEAGTQNVRLEAQADLGIAASSEKSLAIETLAELAFSVADDQDPIETGAETVYEIRVKNTGSRDDTNVKLEVQLPHPALQLVSADPVAGTDGRGRIVFTPIASIPAKGEQVFQIRVRGDKADTHVIKATLVSDQSRTPVTKEESTTVYADQ